MLITHDTCHLIIKITIHIIILRLDSQIDRNNDSKG